MEKFLHQKRRFNIPQRTSTINPIIKKKKEKEREKKKENSIPFSSNFGDLCGSRVQGNTEAFCRAVFQPVDGRRNVWIG